MTDDERLSAIHHETCTNRDAPRALARIRAILADAPSVEWHRLPTTREVWNAYVDGENLLSCHRSRIGGDHWIASAYYGGHSEAHADQLPDCESAQRRAVALYVALRGVT